MSDADQPPEPDKIGQRLDPDAAAKTAVPKQMTSLPGHAPVPVVIDTRRYRWAIGGLGLILVLVLSIYSFAKNGIGKAGVPAGQQLHLFAAPLATSTLDGYANAKPTCLTTKHDPRAMNLCLIVKRSPLVLAFFVTGSDQCKRQVDTLQQLSGRYPRVQFAALAVKAGHSSVAKLARTRGWTIPVAYDKDGRIGELYGIAICPLIELAKQGGTVEQELIGEHWLSVSALDALVAKLVHTRS